MRSFIFNSKKLPKAFLLSLIWISGVNLGVDSLFSSPPFAKPHERLVWNPVRSYRKALQIAGKQNGALIITGNSRATRVNKFLLERELKNLIKGNVLSLASAGNSPIGSKYILEMSKYRCVRRNGVVLLLITPGDYNKNSDMTGRAVKGIFTWKLLFSDLLPNWRLRDVKTFLLEGSAPILRFRKELNCLFARLHFCPEKQEKINRKIINGAIAYRNLNDLRNRYLVNYKLDLYQVDATADIIKKLKERNAYPLLVMAPVPFWEREILGTDNLEIFVQQVYKLGRMFHIKVLDYISGYTGHEYEYFDSLHVTDKSRDDFTRVLIIDVMIHLQANDSLNSANSDV